MMSWAITDKAMGSPDSVLVNQSSPCAKVNPGTRSLLEGSHIAGSKQDKGGFRRSMRLRLTLCGHGIIPSKLFPVLTFASLGGLTDPRSRPEKSKVKKAPSRWPPTEEPVEVKWWTNTCR